MDCEHDKNNIGELDDGRIQKSVDVQIQEVTEDELKKINKYTLYQLSAEEVFTFKVTVGDNETDDRNYQPFNLQALKDLEKLYKGKTVIKDHRRTADGQVARIYDTELISEPKTTKAGEQFVRLIAKCYMVKTASNEDLIKEIKAGIKKEVSTGCRPKKLICNICGTDNMKTYCPHWGGREYEKDTGKTICLMTIDGCKEAYELSFVAVPAQPRAGTTKRLKPVGNTEPEVEEKQENNLENKDLTDSLRTRAIESFLFAQKFINQKGDLKNE